MKKICLLLLPLLLCPSFFWSQTGTKEIKGLVYDKERKQGIEGALVIIKGTRNNVYTNEKGEFVLKSAENTVTLVVYMPSYKTEEFSAESGPQNRLALTALDFKLEEVKISGKAYVQVQEKNNTAFLDFEFYDNLLLALVLKGTAGKDEYLQLLDLNGELLKECKAPLNAEHLEKDCLGNVQLCCTDSVFQVYYDYEKIDCLPPVSRKQYTDILGNCVGYENRSYFFRHLHYRGLRHIYTFIREEEPGKNRPFYIAADSVAIKGFNEDFNINFFLERRKLYGDPPWDYTTIKENLDLLRTQFPVSPEYLNLLRPLQSELIWLNGLPVLLDYTNKQQLSFSAELWQNAEPYYSLTKTDSLLLPGQLQLKALQDKEIKKIYFITKAERPVLYEYNSSQGTFTEKIKLKNFPFVTEAKVKGNKLFFLYRNTREEAIRKLFIYKIN